MTNLIEPNIHPLIVHFVVAFLLTSPLLLIVASFSDWKDQAPSKIQITGDWMLALGILAALGAVAAGLQAYYSVDHDGPSHAAMTTHRNWAFATVGVMAVFGVWRYSTRSAPPSKLFAVLFLLASFGVGATAWKGGQLVYQYGLGVESLPSVTGDGHDHEHGVVSDNGDANSTSSSDDGDGHDHGEHEDDVNEAGRLSDEATTSTNLLLDANDYSSLSPEEVVIAFQTALNAKNKVVVRTLLAPDVIIAEGGGAERSLDEYSGHHMPADMAFMAAVTTTTKQRNTLLSETMATVITESQIHGSYRGETIHSRTMETMVMQKTDNGWLITHIHWSSAPITGEHEH